MRRGQPKKSATDPWLVLYLHERSLWADVYQNLKPGFQILAETLRLARGHHPSIRLSQLVPSGLWDTSRVESDVTVVTISSSTDRSNSKTTSDRFHFLLRFTDGSTTLKVCALSLFNSFFMTSMPSLFGIPWFSRSFVVHPLLGILPPHAKETYQLSSAQEFWGVFVCRY